MEEAVHKPGQIKWCSLSSRWLLGPFIYVRLLPDHCVLFYCNCLYQL